MAAPVHGQADVPRVVAEWEAGATIVLQALHVNWHPLAVFCRLLEDALGRGVQANSYSTPSGSQGFGVHHDTHDVLVLQVAGEKRWRLYDPLLELPLKHQRYSSSLGDSGRADRRLRPASGRHALSPAWLAARGGDVGDRLAAPDDRHRGAHLAGRRARRPRGAGGRARLPARRRAGRGRRARGRARRAARCRSGRAPPAPQVRRDAQADPRGRPLPAPRPRAPRTGDTARAPRDGDRRPRGVQRRGHPRLRGKGDRLSRARAPEVHACLEAEGPFGCRTTR